MEENIIDILQDVQLTSANHQKKLKQLENVYNSVDHERFLEYFLKVIQGVLQEDYNNLCMKLLLEYLAKFVGYFARPHNANDEVDDENDTPTHPFITAVIEEVVKLHDNPQQEVKYNTCNFLSQILHYVGEKTQMDSQICDAVQRAMLENLQDNNYLVRLQAVSALSRLQDPLFPECPVIRAYISCLRDSHHMVRKDVVKRIAPNILSIQKLIERVLDIDANVRCAVFTRLGEIGVRQFKIESRQFILKSGFCEVDQKVKKTFLEFLLPKWMTVLNGDYIAFLNAIKLDAEESDILTTEELSTNCLEVFFKTEPINNLLKALPVDDSKIIPLNIMKKELALYWNILTGYLRKSEDMEEYLDTIIPELTTFCNYIEKLIDTKFKKSMEEWEYLDFQYMLYHLFDIADQYDLSEEVGRRTLDKLLKKVIRNYKFHPRLLNKLMEIASKLSSSKESFANEICLFISDIREPLIEEKTSDIDLRDNGFQLAAFKVKVNILNGELEDAVSEKDFQKAQLLTNEIEEYRRKMDALNVQPTPVDKDVDVCWCLDLLAALLINGNIKALSPSLMTCRQEFLNPLVESKNAEIEWRVFKCIAAYCVFDKQIAEDYVKKLIIPVMKYRILPNFNNIKILISSIAIITDIIRLYGTELFCTEEEHNSTSSTHTSTRRRLYTNENEEIELISDKLSLEIFVNVVLDMLDDENTEIRDAAMESVTKLVLNGFGNSSMVITRLILKWYNPATRFPADHRTDGEKRRRTTYEKNLQQKIGLIIKDYTELVKDSKLTISKAVVPILTSIAEAPRTSPLADVDVENAVRFLGIITDSRDLTYIHRDIGHTLIREISMRPAEVVTPYFAKMLNILNIVPDDSPPTKELIVQAELLLENEALNKIPKQNIEKFIAKLKGQLSLLTSMRSVNTTNESTIGQSSINETAGNKRLTGILEETDNETEASSVDLENANSNTSKKGRIEPTEKASDELENANSNPSKKCRTEPTMASVDKDSEELNVIEIQEKPLQLSNTQGKSSESDPDVISPSISPESQEHVIHNLRKRTRSSYVQESSSKKQNSPESISKKAKRTTKSPNSETISNNNKVVASNKLSRLNINKEKEKEINKNGEGSEILTCSSGLSDSDSSGDLRRSLRVIPSEKVPTDVMPKSLVNQKEKTINDIGNKENFVVSQSASAVSGNNTKPKKQNRRNASKNPNKTSTDGSSEEFVSLNNNTKHVGKPKKDIVIPITKTSTLQNKQSRLNGLLGVNHQSDSTSELSKNARSGSTCSSANTEKRTRLKKKLLTNTTLKRTPSLRKKPEQNDLMSESSSTRSRSKSLSSRSASSSERIKGSSKNNKIPITNKNTRSVRKDVASKSANDSRSESSSTRSRSKSLSSRSASSSERSTKGSSENNKMSGTNRNTRSVGKDAQSNSANPKKLPVINSKAKSQKTLFQNRLRSNSQSNDSDNEEKVAKTKRVNKTKGKDIQVIDKEVEIRVNGLLGTVGKAVNPQVKRKKGRTKQSTKKVTEESVKYITENLGDISDQSLHTIIEPSEFHMSLLSDDSPENSPRKSLQNSKRQRVIISESSSESDALNSSVRKSSRKKKKIVR